MPSSPDPAAPGPDPTAERLPPRGYDGFGGTVDERASRSTPWWPPRPQPPADAPNVVLVVVDDLGFSDIAPYGSEIATPTLDRLASNGYRLTGYHTAPLCAPSRAALLTGLNPHRAGFSYVPHADPGFPNSTMEIADDVPTLAESFRASGYATFMVGKWHLTCESRMHDGADRGSWPVQRGFDQYFGVMDGFSSLTHPHRLVRDNQQVVVDEYPDDYYLTDELTTEAERMIRGLHSGGGRTPFFLYLAHLAVHSPLQARPEDRARYRGRYDAGWDAVRRERFERQRATGVVPAEAPCAGRNDEPGQDVAAWDGLGEDERARYTRYMEVYAGMVDNIDQNLGRLLDLLDELGELDNTVVAFTSDNGASGEGGAEGTRSYLSRFGTPRTTPSDWQPDVPRDLDLVGGPRAFVHYPRGWAWASNTPFRLYKAHVYAGGVRAPFVLSWPAGLPRRQGDNGLRDHHVFVTDVGPTLLDLAGVPTLAERHGRPAPEVDGRSAAALFADPGADGPREEQLFEVKGRRAVVQGRWKALTAHENGPGWRDDEWELYDLASDPAETRDVAADHPEVVARLAARWTELAWHNTVFPLNDDLSMFRTRPSTELALEEPVTLRPYQPTLERYRSAKLVRLRSFDVVVSLNHRLGDEGVLVAHGDQGGGYVLFVEDGRLRLTYNAYGDVHRIDVPVPAGLTEVVLAAEALEGLAWRIALRADGTEVAALDRVPQLVGMCPFTGISVGLDRGGPVDWDLSRRHGCFRYRGDLRHVRYVPGPKAEYNPEVIVDIERQVARVYD